MEKVLSILIPSYNMEKYLDKCLSSLDIKDKEKLEVIAVNDGSKDKTLEIARKYAERYPDTYKVIDKENGNYGSCINAGLKAAQGKYVKVLDADDYFSKEGFGKYLKELENTDSDLIITNYQIVNEDGEVTKKWEPKGLGARETLKWEDVSKNLHESDFQMHAVTYRKDILTKLNYVQQEGIPYTDQQWMFLPMTEVKKITYIDEYVYNYLVGRTGQTVSTDAYVKNISALKRVASQMMKDKTTFNLEDPYFEQRMQFILRDIYYVYLIKMDDRSRIEELRELDNNIKECSPELWTSLEQIQLYGLPVHFIRIWRKSHRKNTPAVIGLIRGLLKLRKR